MLSSDFQPKEVNAKRNVNDWGKNQAGFICVYTGVNICAVLINFFSTDEHQ